MGPKYEFIGETKNCDGLILHRIRRLSDNQLGGWIEKEENLSQEGNCWVNDEAKVYGNAEVCDNAQVYENAEVYDYAEVYGKAMVYGNIEISSGEYVDGKFSCDEDLSENNETKKVLQDFIYSVNDSNKLTTQTECDSIDEFFSEPVKNDIKLDTLIICSVDIRESLIKLQKVKSDNKTEFKFIVDITNKDSDDFIFGSTIKSQEQLNRLIQQTVEALRQYPKFNKYVDDLESCF